MKKFLNFFTMVIAILITIFIVIPLFIIIDIIRFIIFNIGYVFYITYLFIFKKQAENWESFVIKDCLEVSATKWIIDELF